MWGLGYRPTLLWANYIGFSVVRSALIYLPGRVYDAHTRRFDFSYTSSRREAALFHQTQVSTSIKYFDHLSNSSYLPALISYSKTGLYR